MQHYFLSIFAVMGLLYLGCSGDKTQDKPITKPLINQTLPEPTEPLTEESTSASSIPSLKLIPQQITLGDRKIFQLNIPEGFNIHVGIKGLKRPRFMASSPDGRVFITDMINLSDNRKGIVYILDGWDSIKGTFRRAIPYLTGLRNPNNVAFYQDTQGQWWLYVAQTDRLDRYPYSIGDTVPSGSPKFLAAFPDYGMGYKQGGWHLTRTIAFGENKKLYISVGSSCNACIERSEEETRATIVEMNPDGSEQRVFARGLRNAVGLRWANGALWATNMGADHLGDNKPEDTFYRLHDGANCGWPFCYQYRGEVHSDPAFDTSALDINPATVLVATAGFAAHSSPLGFDWFSGNVPTSIQGTFLVALHGASKLSIGNGYRVVRVTPGGAIDDFITGFLDNETTFGRPCDILRNSPNTFLLSDDKAGVVYVIQWHKNIL